MSRVAITDDNKSPLVEIFIWFCLVTSILTVLIRLIIKRYVLQRFSLDDILILVSLVWVSEGRLPYMSHAELTFVALCIYSIYRRVCCDCKWAWTTSCSFDIIANSYSIESQFLHRLQRDREAHHSRHNTRPISSLPRLTFSQNYPWSLFSGLSRLKSPIEDYA